MFFIIKSMDGKVYLYKATSIEDALSRYKARQSINTTLKAPISVQIAGFTDVTL
jgi:hypothetical protein